MRQTGLCEAEKVVEIARMAAVDHGFDLSREQFLRGQNQKRAWRGIRKSRCQKGSRRESAGTHAWGAEVARFFREGTIANEARILIVAREIVFNTKIAVAMPMALPDEMG
jgi:hypothetical protein